MLDSMSEQLARNLQSVRQRIADAARRSGRTAESVALVAVTKKVPVESARALAALGARDLGENYPQELWRKAAALSDPGLPVRWHLIGHLQSNKARKTLPMVRMIHAVDSLRLLRVLEGLVRELGLANPPEVCLQVNTSGEASKHGWSAEGLLADSEAIAACGALPIVGLMTMAAWGTDAVTARPSFVAARQARDALRARSGLALEHLSMGMSGDYETAIEEGATLVRVGSALFEGVLG